MRLVALYLGFEPERLVVHTCRYGAVNQIMAAGHDPAAAMMQGGWTTAGGAWAYMMPTISHSASVANAIHDPSLSTIDWLKHALICNWEEVHAKPGSMDERPTSNR